MVNQDQLQFNERLRRLDRKHKAMNRGYKTYVRPDGLIVSKPRRVQPRVSGMTVAMFLAGLFLFKGFLLASLGAVSYAERVERLSAGTQIEKAGAWVMQADPVSEFIADKIGPILR